VVFFQLRAPWAALGEILALLASIVALVVLVRGHNRAAAAMLVPYGIWVAFAAVLTGTIAAAN
jgi:tryptophan-rich sensory protein